MTDKEKIREEVVRMHNLLPVMDGYNIYVNYADRICTTLEMYIDSLQEEPVSNDLEAFAKRVSKEFAEREYEIDYIDRSALEKGYYFGCVGGAQWQKEHLWKPADGDDLPEIDKEVIVLYKRYPLENNEYAVGFGHRPKEYWDGRNMATGEVTRYYPERYDKGGWNIPDVKFWLDLELKCINFKIENEL